MTTFNLAEHRVFEVLKVSIHRVMPEISPDQVTPHGVLADYGCNSLDRSDIVWKTMDDLGLDIPLTDFAGVRNILGLVQVLGRHWETEHGER